MSRKMLLKNILKVNPMYLQKKLSKHENFCEENFCEEVVMNSQIAKGFLKLNPPEKNSLRLKLSTT